MSGLIEWQGGWWRIRYGAGCEACFELGAAYVHAYECRSEFCVGNGDEHSCLGDWLPCAACGSMTPYRKPAARPALGGAP